ncbi:pyruvate dehydrogenase [acetyl-transferring]-phosphatase 2, mitochondrial-like [Hydractinia symbiolongicarpus]|uniref:pyruvate dehydrogenase [acetyl-transferring]-phosphatase 2, mitochondrial-like n=1 Tax=Hydractinia symbiolongicarpus TaxID=13093 RepID=UPI00254E882E|nr:pyruvate dehydrogenase [acetyl-transferring]-phosphatase 2, mitochondrial-like [Hydractinia symbiolongicarpus]
MRVSTSQWAWGTSAHWRLYHSLKLFRKKWLGSIANETFVDNSKNNVHGKRHSTVNLRPVGHHKKRKTGYNFRRSSSSAYIHSKVSDNLLSDKEVNQKLWSNEKNVALKSEKIVRCETNQLASNEPNEDQLFMTKSKSNDSVLVGVIDGHGGSLFGVQTKQRLPYYLHAALIDNSVHCNNNDFQPSDLFDNVLNKDAVSENLPWFKDINSYLNDSRDNIDLNSSAGNILSYVSSPLKQLFATGNTDENQIPLNFGVSQAIKEAFLRLDTDMISEMKYLADSNQMNTHNLGVALSGCCALVAYLVHDELYVANLGDCRAVLGSYCNGNWSAVQLTYDHTAASSPEEIQRILSEHPADETRSCIQYGRLLGRLAPLRALGDVQFKLSASELGDMFKTLPKFSPMQNLKTPPYLSAEPDVFHYKLEKSDRFIVLASDGLWDMLDNEEVIELVAAYLEGRRSEKLQERAHLYGVANCDAILADPNAFKDSEDENIASFLIRFALAGYDRNNLRAMMSLSYPDVRLYRDDISVAVIFLENDDGNMVS